MPRNIRLQVQDEIIWDVVENKIPELQQQVQALLAQNQGDRA